VKPNQQVNVRWSIPAIAGPFTARVPIPETFTATHVVRPTQAFTRISGQSPAMSRSISVIGWLEMDSCHCTAIFPPKVHIPDEEWLGEKRQSVLTRAYIHTNAGTVRSAGIRPSHLLCLTQCSDPKGVPLHLLFFSTPMSLPIPPLEPCSGDNEQYLYLAEDGRSRKRSNRALAAQNRTKHPCNYCKSSRRKVSTNSGPLRDFSVKI
jgi:hypothetical protein